MKALCRPLLIALLALAPLGVMAGFQAADTTVAALTSPPSSALDDGFLRVSSREWEQRGTPARLQFCLAKEVANQGVFETSFRCTRWGNAQDYASQRFPGHRVQVTRWDFTCLPSGHPVACPPELIVYYRVLPR